MEASSNPKKCMVSVRIGAEVHKCSDRTGKAHVHACPSYPKGWPQGMTLTDRRSGNALGTTEAPKP